MNRPNHKSLLEGSSFEATTFSQQTAINAGFLILIAFAILRPLSLMGKENLAIGVVEITEIMGVSISYLLILPLLLGLKRIKFDMLSLFVMIFIFYSIQSLFWGSEIRKTAKTILPFIVFFSVRTFITETKQAKMLLIFLVLGFLIPIGFSTYNILLGKSVEMVEMHHKMPRFAGAFTGIHTLAYSMLFFSFLYCILHHIYRFRSYFNRAIIGVLLILSVFCLYKSLTRTTMIGFIIFWLIYLWGTNKKVFFIFIALSVLSSIFFSDALHTIFFKKDYIDINTATSGRVKLFVSNIDLFFESSLLQQLFGRGLGHERVFAFHNDYMSLLISFGVIGLLLYLVLYFILCWDIALCKDMKTKYLFGAVLISTAAMNFGSNAIVFRFELSQYFWLIMGLFYLMPQFRKNEFEKT
jgi:hypothetical protein